MFGQPFQIQLPRQSFFAGYLLNRCQIIFEWFKMIICWTKLCGQDVETAVNAASRAFPAWSALTPEVNVSSQSTQRWSFDWDFAGSSWFPVEDCRQNWCSPWPAGSCREQRPGADSEPFCQSGAIRQSGQVSNQLCRADNVYLRVNQWTWPRRWTSRGLPSTSGSSLRFSGFTQFFPAPCFCLQACFFPLYIPGLAAPPGDKQCNAWGRSDQLQFKASCKF